MGLLSGNKNLKLSNGSTDLNSLSTNKRITRQILITALSDGRYDKVKMSEMIRKLIQVDNGEVQFDNKYEKNKVYYLDNFSWEEQYRYKKKKNLGAVGARVVLGDSVGKKEIDVSGGMLYLTDKDTNQSFVLVFKCDQKTADRINALEFRDHPTPLSISEELDPVTEIRKYKQLLDDEIITEDEFEGKKKQLLYL